MAVFTLYGPFYCKTCNKYSRILPDDILPYKQYEREIIEGVQEELINADILGFEDYPSEKQMKRWISAHKKHILKWKVLKRKDV